MPERAPESEDLSLRDLRSFLTVVDEGTFTDAAIALRTTQASVSRHVAALESALGTKLLKRGGRLVTLTTAGRRVIRHARAVRDEIDALTRAVHDDATEIRVGYAWAALGAHTTGVQRNWKIRHPGSEIVFVNSTARYAGVNEGLADVAVVRREPASPAIARATLGHEQRVAAIPSDHPLARRRSVSMADFAGETVAIDTITGTTTANLWTPNQAPGGYRNVTGTDEWLTVIAAGQALGISSQATAEQYARKGISFRPVRDAPAVPVWLIWWRDDPPWFLDELVELIRAEYQAG